MNNVHNNIAMCQCKILLLHNNDDDHNNIIITITIITKYNNYNIIKCVYDILCINIDTIIKSLYL